MARHPETGQARDRRIQVRISPEEERLMEQARGRRTLSVWLREAIRDKIARETGTRL